MYSRCLRNVVFELLQEFRIVYLTGPRQAGKTTLTRSLAEQLGLKYISLDNQTIYRSAKEDPIGFIHELGSTKVILDEFQYVPELIPAIKASSDSLPSGVKGKFLLTGSADIFRSAKTQEALPGHMARLELYPLAVAEMLETRRNIIESLCQRDWHEVSLPALTPRKLAGLILQGGYPEVQSKGPRAKRVWYKSYLEGRLYKDFESLYAAKGDYHSKLQALIPYLAGLSGNLIKYANISNDLGQDDKLVKSYIKILELMFIVKRVPAYIKNTAKRMAITMSKLHMIDTGLACYLLGISTEQQLIASSYFGGLLENFIYGELMKQASWCDQEVQFMHFRDNHQNEVDIVLEQSDGQVIGIEVKGSQTIRRQDFKGLVKLAQYSGQRFRHGVLFYSGEEVLSFSQDGILLYAVPIGLFVHKA